ncbi:MULTISPECIES: tetratricopeptide repeat protein [Halocynthiibacter]|uniref:Tetratricopeptide repeat protein n=1 Tax=Halocynthiibacter halioticoli TaxID=2986804 RepID=A0AAE3IZF3_9RHOB|nr:MULTISPECIES: tetratricopeptide repeat protein [Halocynthiibacter]MCV6824913.1 tetratricopeptide repeat protein [Halocynthiibacter halioticoli]MCW4057914.1 tetratricopeptide repeat protein [Halocynthiibacter sp. SDUM655004]
MLNPFLNRFVTVTFSAIFFAAVSGAPLTAQDGTREEQLDRLFEELADPQNLEWRETEEEIQKLFFDSGSDAMNMLLMRGMTALREGDLNSAIGHFTAVIDHAPSFAEGWNGRATAYFHAGLYGPSMFDIGQTLTLQPRHYGAMLGLGRILEETGKPEQALEVFRQVSILHPNLFGVSDAIARLEKAVGGSSL